MNADAQRSTELLNHFRGFVADLRDDAYKENFVRKFLINYLSDCDPQIFRELTRGLSGMTREEAGNGLGNEDPQMLAVFAIQLIGLEDEEFCRILEDNDLLMFFRKFIHNYVSKCSPGVVVDIVTELIDLREDQWQKENDNGRVADA